MWTAESHGLHVDQPPVMLECELVKRYGYDEFSQLPHYPMPSFKAKGESRFLAVECSWASDRPRVGLYRIPLARRDFRFEVHPMVRSGE